MKKKGKEGEKIAVKFLKDNGYKILDLNFSTPFGEVDIISISPDGFLCFTEVKSESFPLMGIHKMNSEKLKRIQKVANAYIQKTGSKRHLRFDFIWVNLTKGEVIEFLKGEEL